MENWVKVSELGDGAFGKVHKVSENERIGYCYSFGLCILLVIHNDMYMYLCMHRVLVKGEILVHLFVVGIALLCNLVKIAKQKTP